MTNKEIEKLQWLLRRAEDKAYESHWKAFHKQHDFVESDITSEFYDMIKNLRLRLQNPNFLAYLKEEEE